MKKKMKKQKAFITEYKIFPFYFCSNKVSLDHFQDWLNENVPVDAKDVCMYLDLETENDDSSHSLAVCWKREKK
jgi:hypothetical protein